MPELPEVQIQVDLLRRLRGRTITRIDVRDPKIHLPRRIIGRKILDVTRQGKFIVFRLTGDVHLLAHLRMTGWFEIRPQARYRVALFTDGDAVYFDDRRRLGELRAVSDRELRSVLGRLGPEPLGRDFDLRCVTKSSRPIKVALLDQHLIAGLGNIYASESLWRARINPRRRANRLRADELRRLQRAIVATLRSAIAMGDRIFDEPQPFAVYDRARQPCRHCGTRIRRIVQAQRSTYYCPACQR